MPSIWVWPFFTGFDSKLLSRSWGTATDSSPSWPFSTFVQEPLRRFG